VFELDKPAAAVRGAPDDFQRIPLQQHSIHLALDEDARDMLTAKINDRSQIGRSADSTGGSAATDCHPKDAPHLQRSLRVVDVPYSSCNVRNSQEREGDEHFYTVRRYVERNAPSTITARHGGSREDVKKPRQGQQIGVESHPARVRLEI
jgi:hypothetical protein